MYYFTTHWNLQLCLNGINKCLPVLLFDLFLLLSQGQQSLMRQSSVKLTSEDTFARSTQLMISLVLQNICYGFDVIMNRIHFIRVRN